MAEIDVLDYTGEFVHTSNCHGQNCTRRAMFRLGIDTLIVSILVSTGNDVDAVTF